jgi:hypothetical protein
MAEFQLRGRISFDAVDLEEAFLKLALHFVDLAQGHDSNLVQSGEIEVRRLDDVLRSV